MKKNNKVGRENLNDFAKDEAKQRAVLVTILRISDGSYIPNDGISGALRNIYSIRNKQVLGPVFKVLRKKGFLESKKEKGIMLNKVTPAGIQFTKGAPKTDAPGDQPGPAGTAPDDIMKEAEAIFKQLADCRAAEDDHFKLMREIASLTEQLEKKKEELAKLEAGPMKILAQAREILEMTNVGGE